MGTPLLEHPGKIRRVRRFRQALLGAVAVAGWLLAGGGPAAAQGAGQANPLGDAAAGGSRYALAESVSVDEAETVVRTYLDRAKAYLADGQWDEAIQTYRRVAVESGDKLIGVTPHRYLPVRDYCQLQLTALPPKALAVYRDQVDATARSWYESGVARHERGLLQKVVNEALASSYGDDALAALGDMALEEGDFASARSYWEKIVPADPPPGTPHTWLGVTDTDLDLAAVRARLVLASILEGSADRAQDELARFRQLHPDSRGRLGGVEVDYSDALATLLAESASWPKPESTPGWPTFAGSDVRARIAPVPLDPGGVAWRFGLRASIPANAGVWGSAAPTVRAAEDARRPLSYHPVLYGNIVLANDQTEIFAVDLATGRPAWGASTAAIYRDQFNDPIGPRQLPAENLGVPRFTMTIAGDRLYARMGPPATGHPTGESPGRAGCVVAIDLAEEGRLLWKAVPPGPDWAMDGSPLADEANVYVAMRRGDIQPRAYVACLDAATGRIKWNRFVAAAATPAHGTLHETTHNLLSLDHGTLYFNTNLGAVAAISASDGAIRWVSLYPRRREGDLLQPAGHESRDLTPCLFDRGWLYVAPSDSPRIFAFDSGYGQMPWQTSTAVEDAVHLLGVVGNQLIAAGDRLYWIDLEPTGAGSIRHVWPEGGEKLGYGRGLITADESIWWPGRDKIYVLDGRTAKLKEIVDLLPRGTTGGNLLSAAGRLLIATDHELVALGEGSLQDNATPPALAGWQFASPLDLLNPEP